MAATQYEIVHEVLDLAGARWTVEVLSVLRSGRRRFNEIAREVSGISQKQLTLTLRTLQRGVDHLLAAAVEAAEVGNAAGRGVVGSHVWSALVVATTALRRPGYARCRHSPMAWARSSAVIGRAALGRRSSRTMGSEANVSTIMSLKSSRKASMAACWVMSRWSVPTTLANPP